MSKIINLLAALVIAAALLGASQSTATSGTSSKSDPLPTCETFRSLNCTGTFTNTIRGDMFCRTIGERTRCETYWPFHNPTVNAHSAP